MEHEAVPRLANRQVHVTYACFYKYIKVTILHLFSKITFNGRSYFHACSIGRKFEKEKALEYFVEINQINGTYENLFTTLLNLKKRQKEKRRRKEKEM